MVLVPRSLRPGLLLMRAQELAYKAVKLSRVETGKCCSARDTSHSTYLTAMFNWNQKRMKNIKLM